MGHCRRPSTHAILYSDDADATRAALWAEGIEIARPISDQD
jgi:hypothetical protein